MQLSLETRMEIEDLVLDLILSKLGPDELELLEKQGRNWKDAFADLADDMTGELSGDFHFIVMNYFTSLNQSWLSEINPILEGDQNE